MTDAPTETGPQRQTVQVVIELKHRWIQVLQAELSDQGFHAFEVESNRLTGYVHESAWSDALRKELIKWILDRQAEVSIKETYMPAKNWNRVWEESLEPVRAGAFLIVPSWKAEQRGSDDAGLTKILIDPKMSFGTGHHVTTRLMLEMMSSVDMRGKEVLDAGTGTGVLAIAASKQGAKFVTAFDNDPWSIINAGENISANSVRNARLVAGSAEAVPGQKFDVILSNIDRDVVTALLPYFREVSVFDADLLLSGICVKDADKILDCAKSEGFVLRSRVEEGEWIGLHLVARS